MSHSIEPNETYYVVSLAVAIRKSSADLSDCLNEILRPLAQEGSIADYTLHALSQVEEVTASEWAEEGELFCDATEELKQALEEKKQTVLDEYMRVFKDIFDIDFALIANEQDSAHLIEQHFERKVRETTLSGSSACQQFLEENDRMQCVIDFVAEHNTTSIEVIANNIYQSELNSDLYEIDFDAMVADFEAIDDDQEALDAIMADLDAIDDGEEVTV